MGSCLSSCPMARSSPIFALSPEPITSETGAFWPGEGAEVQFLGVVRGEEKGQVIRGIEYSAYLPMAERMLRELVDQGAA